MELNVARQAFHTLANHIEMLEASEPLPGAPNAGEVKVILRQIMSIEELRSIAKFLWRCPRVARTEFEICGIRTPHPPRNADSREFFFQQRTDTSRKLRIWIDRHLVIPAPSPSVPPVDVASGRAVVANDQVVAATFFL
jgi:hypothetical protein